MERHVTLATPAVSQADQGRQRAAGHPAPTVTAGVAPATHLWRRDREAQRGHQPRRGAARSEERRSGALLRRSATARAAKRRPLLHLQEHCAARLTGLVHCAGAQGVAPARSRGASPRLAGCSEAPARKSHFSPKEQHRSLLELISLDPTKEAKSGINKQKSFEKDLMIPK